MDGPPTCLLHVPKAAGTSMRIAIQRALPHGALAPWHSEPAVYADFTRFDEMKDPFRSTIALDEDHIAALGSHAAVFGHFTLSTLLRLSEPSSIGTVLREPRSRLLSHYAYWRTEPGLAERVAPYHMAEHAQRPLDEFLAEPRIARQTDNIVCRLLLFGDERAARHGLHRTRRRGRTGRCSGRATRVARVRRDHGAPRRGLAGSG